MSRSQRRDLDAKCKEYLQQIEDRVKAQCIFKSGKEYRKHYDAFHKKYEFKCIYAGCTKVSSSWYNFVAHLTQHDRETGRPFLCAFPGCNRRSSTKHNLIKHLQGVHKWQIVNKEQIKNNKSNINGNNGRNRKMVKIIPRPDHDKITQDIAPLNTMNTMPSLNMNDIIDNHDIEMQPNKVQNLNGNGNGLEKENNNASNLSFPSLIEQQTTYSSNLAQDIPPPIINVNNNTSMELKQEPLKDLEKMFVKPHYQKVQEQEDHIFSIDDARPITPSFLKQQVKYKLCI